MLGDVHMVDSIVADGLRQGGGTGGRLANPLPRAMGRPGRVPSRQHCFHVRPSHLGTPLRVHAPRPHIPCPHGRRNGAYAEVLAQLRERQLVLLRDLRAEA